jgi:transcriptional regulator with XRE-family HTH domain
LQWLRYARNLRQEDVVTGAEELGVRLSKPYYAQAERGERSLSDEKLDAVLETLGSSRLELDVLTREAPWETSGEPVARYRISNTTPKKPQTMAPLAELDQADVLNRMEAAARVRSSDPAAYRETLDETMADSPPAAAPRARMQRSPAVASDADATPAGAQPSVDAQVAAELVEVASLWADADPMVRRTLLGMLRSDARHRSGDIQRRHRRA